jgi:O-antigen/teichoic acid export membrane protein
MYPIYGKKQQDTAALKKYYLMVVLFNCIFIFPVMIFFAVEGYPFIVNVFGLKWQDTVTPLQILAVSVMFHILVSGNTALLRGLGRPGMEMKQQVIKSIVYLPSLATGIYFYGIAGAAWAILLNKIVGVIVAQYTFKFLIPVKISLSEFMIALRPVLIAACAGCVTCYFFNRLGLNYLVCGSGLIVVYATVIWLMMSAELKNLLKGFRN